MTITINSHSLELPEGATVGQALATKEISTAGTAVALNGAVVARDKVATTELHNGDQLIVIKAFYGG